MNAQCLVVKSIFYKNLSESTTVTEIKINRICCITEVYRYSLIFKLIYGLEIDMPSPSSQGLETAEIYCSIDVYDVKILTDSNKMALLIHQVGNLIHELLLVGCKGLNPQLLSKGFKFSKGMLPISFCLQYSSK